MLIHVLSYVKSPDTIANVNIVLCENPDTVANVNIEICQKSQVNHASRSVYYQNLTQCK